MENFGLVAKSNKASDDSDSKIINVKIRVEADFHERWTRTMTKLSKHYVGGGAAVVHHSIVEMLPQLEEMARLIPDGNNATQTTAKKSGVK